MQDMYSENTKQFNIQLFRTMSNVKTTTTSVKLTVDSLVRRVNEHEDGRRPGEAAAPGEVTL